MMCESWMIRLSMRPGPKANVGHQSLCEGEEVFLELEGFQKQPPDRHQPCLLVRRRSGAHEQCGLNQTRNGADADENPQPKGAQPVR